MKKPIAKEERFTCAAGRLLALFAAMGVFAVAADDFVFSWAHSLLPSTGSQYAFTVRTL